MRHKILATKIAVALSGASRLSYGLSILGFEADEDLNALYVRLKAGRSVCIYNPCIEKYDKEEPGLLLAEYPLLLSGIDEKYFLSMP